MKRSFPRPAVLVVLPLSLALVAGCGDEPAKKKKPGAAPTSRAPAVSASPVAPENGIEKLPPGKILARALKATKAARTVRLKGTVKDGEGSFALDLRVQGKTKALAELTTNSQTIQVTRIGPDAYMKSGKAFYTDLVGAEAAKLLAGKYLKAKVNDPQLKDFLELLDFTELLKPEGTVKKGDLTKSGDYHVISLVDKNKETIHVATEGEPRIMTLVDATMQNQLVFTYDEPTVITAPDQKLVVDITKIKSPG